MKDPAHHIAKLNREVVRSVHDELNHGLSLPDLPPRQQTERQLKKQAKQRAKDAKLARPSSLPTPEEQNRKMLHRVPVFDRMSHDKPYKPPHQRKKAPRI